MARSYTTRTILDGGQAKDEDFNSEIQTPLGEFNGQLDQNQLPLQSVNYNHIAQPTTSTAYLGQDGTYSTYMQTQGYHQSEYALPLGFAYPRMEWDNTLYAGQGWIKLQDFQLQTHAPGQTGGAEIIFNSYEGMIAGSAVIDFDWYPGTAENSVTDPYPLTLKVIYAYKETIEWGVFIDDVLVSKSGVIYPRRLTLNLPFNAPTSTKPLKIDVRFRCNFIDPSTLHNNAETDIRTTIGTYQALTYNGGCLWTRNQFR